MKILIDMNVSPEWAAFFHTHGFAASHWSWIGRPSAPDSEIFAWARSHDYAIFTHDLDFSTILAASGSTKPSVIQLRHPDIAPFVHGARIALLLRQFESELQDGALLLVEPDKHRVRLLPLQS